MLPLAFWLALLPLANPNVNSKEKQSLRNTGPISDKCMRDTSVCGEFEPPSDEGASYYHCKLHTKRCWWMCSIRCKKGIDGKKMKTSRRKKNFYQCNRKTQEWELREPLSAAYCQARVTVAEVTQRLTLTEDLNELINRIIQSSHGYLSMASFYERADVALPGFSKSMTDLWQANMKHARDLMTYLNTRGGYVNLEGIARPSTYEDLMVTLDNRSGLYGLRKALNETKYINSKALEFHAQTTVDRRGDPHLKHTLEDGLLEYSVKTIKKLADLENQLLAFTSDDDYSIGEYTMDLQLREEGATA